MSLLGQFLFLLFWQKTYCVCTNFGICFERVNRQADIVSRVRKRMAANLQNGIEFSTTAESCMKLHLFLWLFSALDDEAKHAIQVQIPDHFGQRKPHDMLQVLVLMP